MEFVGFWTALGCAAVPNTAITPFRAFGGSLALSVARDRTSALSAERPQVMDTLGEKFGKQDDEFYQILGTGFTAVNAGDQTLTNLREQSNLLGFSENWTYTI